MTNDYQHTYHGDAADYAAELADYYKQQQETAAYLINDYKAYRDIIGDEEADSQIASIRARLSALNSAVQLANTDAKYWSQFENEADYSAAMFDENMYEQHGQSDYQALSQTVKDNEATIQTAMVPYVVNAASAQNDWLENYASYIEYERLSNYDIEAAEDELERQKARLSNLEAAANKAYSLTSYGTNDEKNQAQKDYNTYLSLYEYMSDNITARQQELNLAKSVQTANTYNAYLEAPDFTEFSEMGAAIENPSVWEAERGLDLFGWRPFAKDIGNIVTYSRNNYDELALGAVNNSQMEGDVHYKFMTDDEVDIYNYLLAKEGDGAAQEYLGYLEETLNYRQGSMWAENIGNIESGIGRTFATGAFGLGAGLDQFGSGLKQLGTSDRLPTSATQFASTAIRDDLSVDWIKLPDWMGGSSLAQTAYDVVTTTGTMAPAILTSAVTAGLGAPAAIANGVGAITLGASAKGNAYNQALFEGYTKEQAQAYSTLIGASEAGLQYLLGGISGISGKLLGKPAQAAIQNIDNALLRVGATVGLDMVSEGTEEYLQEILMPVFRNIALGEDNEFRLVTPDAVYSYMLGALTAGFIESGNAAFSNTHARDVGAGILQAGKGDTLLQSAFMLDPGSETYKLADQIAAGFVQSNDINIGNLFVSYIRDGGSADILAPDESDIISNAVNDVGNTVVDDMVDNWNGVDSENNDADGNWDDVISDALAGNDETGYNGSATEGAGELVDNRPYLDPNSRPSFRKGVVESTWNNAKGPDGLVRDPNTGDVINWSPGQSRKDIWDMGHVPGQKYYDMYQKYIQGEMTPKQFRDWYNNPNNYRPEIPRNNRGHLFE